MEAGRLKNHEPSPISVTIRAATATEAPSSRADSATTGRMAPWPMLNSSAGPNAGTAMLRRLKGGGLFGGVIPFILGSGPRQSAAYGAKLSQHHTAPPPTLPHLPPPNPQPSLTSRRPTPNPPSPPAAQPPTLPHLPPPNPTSLTSRRPTPTLPHILLPLLLHGCRPEE